MKFCLELRKNWPVWLFFAFWVFFFSFRLTKIPPGINIDESSIGYNASLIADTLHDENGRFLPVFFLTIGQKDWKQPVRIYTTALFFRFFGKNYFNLRFVSVIMAVFSGIVFYFLLRLFFSRLVSILGTFFLFSSPSMLIQSHLALENIDCLPFFLLWLYFLLSFFKAPKIYKIVLSGIFLGASFYSYKGMHAYVWMYLVMTLFAIPIFLRKVKLSFRPIILFLAGAAPFLLPLKLLQTRYAGAVYDPAIISLPSFFDSANVFLSTFDFSFLFLKGDKMLIHSTGYHGMFLILGLFFLVIGLIKAVKKNNRFFNFLFLVLVATPLPLIAVKSVYRASRLMVLIPLFSFIFALGLEYGFSLKKTRKKILFILLTVLYSISWLFFLVYYFDKYPKTIAGQFSPNFNSAMKVLSQKSTELEKTPFVEKELFLVHEEDIKYFWLVYFPNKKINLWEREKFDFPKDGLILTGIGASGETINTEEIPALQSGQKTLYIVKKKN